MEIYVKEQLELQRHNRWTWFLNFSDDSSFEEFTELCNLFKVNNINVFDFACDLKRLLLCEDEKKNCMFIWGTPNSGKTLIARLICEHFITGYVNNHNSENEFYFQCFLNKSMALCEELMVTPATAEDFKTILGGQPLLIAKKYNDKQPLQRTPIIITSNHNNFGRGHIGFSDEDALQRRCFIYNFNACYKPNCHITAKTFSHFIDVHYFAKLVLPMAQ